MHTTEAGLKLIERFEGFSDKQYKDAVGVPTIGYGTTASVVSPLPETCTQAEAEGWLRKYVAEACEPSVNRLGVPLNSHQFDALVSLVYNCGPGVLEGTIGQLLRARNYAAAANAFMLYVHAGGQVIQGLVNRRAAEKALFKTPVPRPKPPDPYRHFDHTVRDLGGGHRGSEYDIVKEYDRKRKRPKLHAVRLRTLRNDCDKLAERLTDVMLRSTDKANRDNWRIYRRRELRNRAKGESVRP